MFLRLMFESGSAVRLTSPSSGKVIVNHTSFTFFDTEPVLLVPLSHDCAIIPKGISNSTRSKSKYFLFIIRPF